jgi:hypothetical protein
MSAAPREPDNAGPSHERSDGEPWEQGSAMYAPRAVRELNRAPPVLPPVLRTEPPWRVPGQPGAFIDDDAMAEARRRLPLKTHSVDPRAPAPPVRKFGARGWFIGVTLIAGGAGGYMWGVAPRAIAPERSWLVAEAQRAVLPTGQVASREIARVPTPVPRLMVDAVRVWRADEPARLAIWYTDTVANVSVVIDGLAPGSALLAGMPAAPNAWRLANTDLKRAVIRPPGGFVGVMNLTLELRLADDTVVDRKMLQLEWSGASAPASTASAQSSQRHLDAAEIALLMKRGAEWVATGNIGAARMMFQSAAEAGDPTAAFALAETYDPLALEKLGAKGITPDITLAQRWYEKARALGSTAAPERLVRLAR